MVRTVLHCDLNNFFASVECMLHPNELLGKKFAVAGNPNDAHGIILAKNTAARRYGVRTGETIWEAREKCPDLLFVPPSYDSYVCFSKMAYEIYKSYTDKVQCFGIDECWLDITETVPIEKAKTFADSLRNEIKNKIGLTISVGASFTKSFAKLGSDMKKPNGTTLIDTHNYREKIYNMPAKELLYVGPQTNKALSELNVHTIGELAHADENLLRQRFGINGVKLKNMALGEDDDPVTGREFSEAIKSVGHGTTVKNHLKTFNQAKQVIFMLSEMVGIRLRRYGMNAKLVHLYCQNDLLISSGKQMPMSSTTSAGVEIARKAYEILENIWSPKQNPLRSITVSTGNLTSVTDNRQISIFENEIQKQEKIENVMDGLRTRFGRNSINRAILMDSVFAKDDYVDKSIDDDYLPFKR
ncbi:MAG TPA: DNA polymerase IV [Clostridia bacterium]|nr:DNA polymerase IV [Clostridia bacterium]